MGAPSDSSAALRCGGCHLGEWAAVQLTDGSEHHGVLHAADPESGHVVLLQPVDDADDPQAVAPLVLFGPSILTISQARTRTPSAARDGTLTRESDAADAVADVDVDAQRASFRDFLRTEGAPFEEHADGRFVVLGCLEISAPYTRRSIRCENATVLERFLDILDAKVSQTS